MPSSSIPKTLIGERPAPKSPRQACRLFVRANFRVFSQHFANVCKIFVAFTCFLKFSERSDVFGCVRIRSDAFGCVWMRLDGFGRFRKILEIFGFGLQNLMFFGGFRKCLEVGHSQTRKPENTVCGEKKPGKQI